MFMKILCLRTFTREDALKAITVIVSEALDEFIKEPEPERRRKEGFIHDHLQ